MKGRKILFILLFLMSGSVPPLFGRHFYQEPAKPSHDHVSLVDSINHLAGVFLRTEPDSAQALITESLEVSRQYDYTAGVARALFLQGNYYQNRGQLELAYRTFYESLQLHESEKDKKSVAECYNSIGDVFRRQKNYKEASRNYDLSFALANEIGDSALVSENINNFGDVFRDQKDYDAAILRYNEALEIDLKINNGYGVTDGYNNLGDVYLYLADYDQAISYYNRALRLAESMNNQLEVADNLNKLGRAYAAKDDLETALFYSKLAATVSGRIRLTEELMEAYYSLAEVYQRVGRYDKALESHMLYSKFQDSLLDVRSVRKISELQFLFESEKKDSEILLKEAELETQSVQLKWLITAVILLIILALVFYRNYISKQRVNNKLIAQQEEIKRQTERLEEKNRQLKIINEEKNEIIGMVAHDLRAPINQVMSVVNLMHYEKESFSDDMVSYLSIMERATTRMKFMVSEILDAEAIENSTFNMDIENVDLCEIIEEEKKNYRLYADKKKLKLTTELVGNPACARVDKNIYRNIIENLLSNALKYSPEGKEIKLILRFEADRVVTSVKDEGPGLSDEDMKRVFGKYQRLSAQPTGGEESIGLGLSLVKKFTEAMNGEVWCESTEGNGAEFFVSFEKVTSNSNK
ncbi:tetratricopeptide repeat-containing sensor histidine kinase [Imperialibacter roseus]|uniref:histidine kinase n=1 Tax=Imperialibacter roseus TaxID=1324217 RepID=A0ABZ0IR49_9BACT|nr:tetratricopeptide repeat-containing sensor histidine kinase [Imperialibacter roseus]WOK07528.1 tetratricopeptide repeat-containing sensor histidine kinase [Imperialibacter roseus]|tara:strand:- start:27037 stop:28959 length:1923 start_codon:yes stop_codon:yes gene_type:complete